MKKFNIKTSFKTFLVVSLLSSTVTNYADDTEVFFSVNVSKPNLLFVLDNSGSMAYDAAGNPPTISRRNKVRDNPAFTSPSRMTILKNTVAAVLAAAPNNVNIGLMRYGPGENNLKDNNGTPQSEINFTTENVRTHSVSGVQFPLTDINASANSVIATPADATLSLPNHGTVPAADVTVRDYVTSIVKKWKEGGGTPITGALYEAALYYRGEKVHYGQSKPNSTVGAHPSTYYGNPITTDITNGTNPRNNATAPKYISPITSSCQNNYIALMSDGYPTYYYKGGALTQTYKGKLVDWDKNRGPFATIMQGNTGYSDLATAITACVDAPDGFTSGKCAPEITSYIANNDNIADSSATNPNGLDGMQTVKTFTVGFGVAPGSPTEKFLKHLATIEDDPKTKNVVEDGYFSADNKAALIDAFNQIIRTVAEPSGTLASPGYSVNVKSGLEHEKDIYIPVFDRKDTSRWSGNLKKFTLVDVNDKRKIRGKNNLDAVDELGGFTAAAWDEWSQSAIADGRNIDKGGAASLIDNPEEDVNTGRKLYSNLTNNPELKASGNRITRANFAKLTDADLGIVPSTDDADYRKTLASFIRGYMNGDETAAARKHMGDMLHSEPLVVTYTNANANGDGKKQYIFAGTNEGYLHAFDTATGKEKFAFMPKELLKNIDSQFLNTGTQKDHKYGVDGSLTYWKDPADGKRYLYFGLRRGGSSYYALDITSIDSPKLVWIVSGDNYPSMGQSWSAPYLANVGVGSDSTKTPAVIFTGGYDEADDRDSRVFCANEFQTCTVPANSSATIWYGANDTWVSKNNVTGSIACRNSVFGDPLVGVRKSCQIEVKGGYNSRLPITATKGNDVFIFNAKTGNYIWSLQESGIGDSEIVNSIPGGARILDTNYNGLIDRMYFGDTGGFVWRLDLGEKLVTSAGSDSKLYKFAELGTTFRNDNSRKFYNEPDVSVMKLKGKTTFLVSIGSGFRAHPMDKRIKDKFFMLLDKTPFTPRLDENGNDIDPILIRDEDLSDINISSTGAISQRIADDNDGWVVNFSTDGEKSLATSVTVDGVVLFTTLIPETLVDSNFPNIDLCAAPATQGRLYAVNIFTGDAGLDLNEDGIINDSDFSTLVAKGEIPSKPQQIVNKLELGDVVGKDGKPTGKKSCKHPVDVRVGKKLSQATGYDTCRLESVYWSDPATDQ